MGWYGIGPWMWLSMGLFWLLLIVVIIWLVARLTPMRRYGDTRQAEAPEEILDRRFARGEIDIETYQAHRAALLSSRSPGRR
jgi:putative membrane protein